jgi:predicted flap endonuclease-1-like 5' DNA nuclease
LVKLTDIHGMDPNLEERLRDMGIRTPEALLRSCPNGAGSLRISLQTGVAREKIQTLVAQADLIRLRGIGVEYARMLVATGVRSIEEMAGKDPATLADALLEQHVLDGASGQPPSERQVARWVRQAQSVAMGH